MRLLLLINLVASATVIAVPIETVDFSDDLHELTQILPNNINSEVENDQLTLFVKTENFASNSLLENETTETVRNKGNKLADWSQGVNTSCEGEECDVTVENEEAESDDIAATTEQDATDYVTEETNSELNNVENETGESTDAKETDVDTDNEINHATELKFTKDVVDTGKVKNKGSVLDFSKLAEELKSYNSADDYFVNNKGFALPLDYDGEEFYGNEDLPSVNYKFGKFKIKNKIKKTALPTIGKLVAILATVGAIDETAIDAIIEGVQEVQTLIGGDIIPEGIIPTIPVRQTSPSTSPVLSPIDLDFRGNEKTAEAKIRGNGMKGEIYFIQNYDDNNNPADVVIAGTLENMNTGTYDLRLYDGVLSGVGGCSVPGPQISPKKKWDQFEPDVGGDALIFLLDSKLSLDGSDSILGSTVMVTNGRGQIGCGVISDHEIEGLRRRDTPTI